MNLNIKQLVGGKLLNLNKLKLIIIFTDFNKKDIFVLKEFTLNKYM